MYTDDSYVKMKCT